MIVIHWRGIIRFRGIPRSYTIPLPSRYCSPPIVATILSSWYNALLPFTREKRSIGFPSLPNIYSRPVWNDLRNLFTIPRCPLFRQEFLGNVHDNFAYKNSDLQVHRFIITLLLERVCNRRPLLRSFERYACIFTRTGWISLRFTLFPQRYRFFFSPLNNRFLFLSFFFFFFNFLYYYPPLCDIASSSQIVVDSRKLFIHFLSIAL